MKIVLFDNKKSIEYELPCQKKITLGRGTDSDVTIEVANPEESKTSRIHSLIKRNGGDGSGSAFIEDYNSQWGTYVNYEKVETRRLLHGGDFVGLGPDLLLEVRVD